jgi:hypothetical protein
VSPQLDEPPGTTGSKFLLGKQAQRHQVKISIDFPKEQFTKSNSFTFGQFICQGEVVFGWGKGRSVE